MDPLTVLKFAEILKNSGEKILNNAKIDRIIEKLNELSAVCNEIILRDLRGAYKSLQDYLACDGEYRQWKIIDHVEGSLLRNTGLDPEVKIGIVNASDVVAISYYGLSFIYSLRGNNEVAERYLFRMFESSSRLARIDLSPDVYERFIKPYCKECYEQHENRIRHQAKTSDYFMQAGRGIYCGAVGVGAVLLGMAHPSTRGAAMQVGRHIESVWKEGADAKVWNSTAELEEYLERSLDIQSAKVAKDILSGAIKI